MDDPARSHGASRGGPASPPLASSLIGAIAAPYRGALRRGRMWTFLPWLPRHHGRTSFGKSPLAAVSGPSVLSTSTLLAEAREAPSGVAMFSGPGS